ncbi:GGDEF domain-containing protein [Histidinibacterium lentulum]|nr:GGDEF domain-containing protein [Histidinibacterium lentulum]
MVLYRLLQRPFPRSFVAKAFAVVGAGFVLPFLGILAYGLQAGAAADRTLIAVVLASGTAGLVLAFLGIRALLEPVFAVTGALDLWGRSGQLQILPEDFGDEVGVLMVRTNRLMARAQRSLDQSRREQDTDPLTGALNRRGAERLLRDAPPGWLMLIDLDRFHKVNERAGQAEGDRILREVVQVCSDALRQDDVLARIAGEEFLVFLPGATREVAARVAERLRREIAEKVTTRGVSLTASVGLAAHPGGEAIEGALEIAGAELARAKDEGSNCVRGADPARAA